MNEEEELTHYGQSLAEIEKFNDAVGSDDESEEKGLLSGETETPAFCLLGFPNVSSELTRIFTYFLIFFFFVQLS